MTKTDWTKLTAQWKPFEHEVETPEQTCLDCGASSTDGTEFDLIVHWTRYGYEYDVECGKCGSNNTECY